MVLLLLYYTSQFLAALCLEESGCLKSSDPEFLALQSPQQLLESAQDPLAHQPPLKPEQTRRS